MIGKNGVIYETSRFITKKNKHFEGLNGNSGVGQASEFPFKLSKKLRKHVHLFTIFFPFFKKRVLSLALPKHRMQLPTNSGGTSFARSFGTLRSRHPTIKSNRLLSIRLGTFLMLVAVGGFLWTFGPILKVQIGYRLVSSESPSSSRRDIGTPAGKSGFAGLLGSQLIGEIPGIPDPQFSLLIPKIHAKAKIIANVDPTDYASYMEALKIGVAHAKGSGFPGTPSANIYLFAHSTDDPINVVRFNAVFYLLSEVEAGDAIEVYFMGVKHLYTVIETKIVEPTDVTYLTPKNGDGNERLVLQTCYPPGTTLKRLLVIGEKKQ